MGLSVETIRRHLDETTCDSCGAPLYVGDRVLYDLQQGTAYCGRSCAEAERQLVLAMPAAFAKAA